MCLEEIFRIIQSLLWQRVPKFLTDYTFCFDCWRLNFFDCVYMYFVFMCACMFFKCRNTVHPATCSEVDSSVHSLWIWSLGKSQSSIENIYLHIDFNPDNFDYFSVLGEEIFNLKIHNFNTNNGKNVLLAFQRSNN